MAQQDSTGTRGAFWQTSPRRLAEDRWPFLVMAALLLAFYLPGLGSYGLYDPWETHYGEVARNMVEYDNYIDPWWGSPWDPAGAKREREGFYSKPPLIMWMMSAGMNLFGFTELGVRFFFPLAMVMALLAIYLAVSRFYNRRAGVIAAGLTASSPFVAMLGRQAVTDGPMVSIMTAGMMALAVGLFRVDEDEDASPLLYWATLGFFLLVVAAQLWTILPMDRSPDVVRPYPGERGFPFNLQWWLSEVFTVGRGKGIAVVAALLPLGVWAGWRVARQRRRRMLYIYLFYICCGLTIPAKGWLGLAPMGGAILGYLIVTGEWKVLSWVDVPTGLLVVFMCGHPWVVAMLGGHHPAWYDRFIIHDHIKRLTSGVHSIDDGAFEYFFRWIGYGLFPWIGLLPGAIARSLGGLRKSAEGYTRAQKFELLVFLWAIFGFFLFTKSSTKFHHYIFPVIPPLAILCAIFLEDVLERRGRNLGIFLGAGAGIVLWVGQDLFRMPAAYGQGSQNLVNLFTYKYDREWPQFTGAGALEKLQGDALAQAVADNEWLQMLANGLGWMTLLGLVGFLLMAFFRDWKRNYGAAVLGIAGVWCGWWCLQTYLPEVSVHWSQKGMWDAYYAHCTKFGPDEQAEYERHMLLQVNRIPSKPEMFPRERCVEPIVAFRTNWRGEAFYSANTVIPTIETKYLEPFLKQWGNDKPFYLFTEKSRVKSELEPTLPKHLKGQYETVFGHNLKFVLLRIEKGKGAEPGDEDGPVEDSPGEVSGGGE
ncbi:MAG: glycosyltransferase family 39 protein [Myxococcales bacterium]|nr:glycosyltransferase family 39 protein [Myxococcales bacterium]